MPRERAAMTLAQYWRVLAKHWFVAVVPFVLLVGAALALSVQATPTYTAKSSAWFTLPVGQTGADLFQGANYTQAQLGSYSQLATKPIVLEPVIDSLSLDTTPNRLANAITATVVPESVVIQIAVNDPDPRPGSTDRQRGDPSGRRGRPRSRAVPGER